MSDPVRTVSRLVLTVASLLVLELAPARANRIGAREQESALAASLPALGARFARQPRALEPRALASDSSGVFNPEQETSLPQFHSDLVSSDAVAFFFPPVTVPPRPVPEPPIPVTPHLPPPPAPHSPPPTDTAPEPATLLSGILGAGLAGLYSLRRRARKG